MNTRPTNDDEMIDSRDVMEALDEISIELEDKEALDREDLATLLAEELSLKALAEQGKGCRDWEYGEQLIRHDHFTSYIKELISDCYEVPKELKSGDWPWRHMTIDYEAAAQVAKVDYMTVEFDGVEYLMRA